MSLKDELEDEVQEIVSTQWNVRKGRAVPDPEDIQLGNHASELVATVLYADLADSTLMVDEQTFNVAAEVYKSYLACAARIIKANGGSITAYDGDRIMAVFIGDRKNTSAAKTGLQITWAVNKIVNPALSGQYGVGAYQVRHVIGIDSSSLRAARIGVRNDNDLVWVGRAANHAAKLSSITDNQSAVYISKTVYDAMHETVKLGGNPKRSMWTSTTFGGRNIYRSNWQWSLD
ncbi:MAG TPA: adenylate/guanylate cyclase domain-containing protein [Acidobacteriaceae bacterium]|jgi:class 3 adenylate cyclase